MSKTKLKYHMTKDTFFHIVFERKTQENGGSINKTVKTWEFVHCSVI